MDEEKTVEEAVSWENRLKKETWEAKEEIQDLEEDLMVIQAGRWWGKVQSKEEWRRIVREDKAHPGL
jgi:hypothetical protein